MKTLQSPAWSSERQHQQSGCLVPYCHWLDLLTVPNYEQQHWQLHVQQYQEIMIARSCVLLLSVFQSGLKTSRHTLPCQTVNCLQSNSTSNNIAVYKTVLLAMHELQFIKKIAHLVCHSGVMKAEHNKNTMLLKTNYFSFNFHTIKRYNFHLCFRFAYKNSTDEGSQQETVILLTQTGGMITVSQCLNTVCKQLFACCNKDGQQFRFSLHNINYSNVKPRSQYNIALLQPSCY